jgi:hypothetical protein
MKTILLIICIYLSISINIIAQTQANVKTPNYSDVKAYITPENTDAWREYFDNYYTAAYPNADPIDTYPATGNPSIYYSSTRRFNCHGHAWYMTSNEGSELNDPRWIGYAAGNEDEHVYWLDESYTEVSSEVYPGKVSYDPDNSDHSAITTSTTGRYISKWNEWPLMEHDWDDTPFGTPDLIYYKLNCYRKIEGKTINTDLTRTGCQVLLKNVTIQNNVDLDITFENWFKIEGTFVAISGTTLNIEPE